MKKTAIGTGLTKKQLTFVGEARKLFFLSDKNIYIWCDLLGYSLFEVGFFDEGMEALFIRTEKRAFIVIKAGISEQDKILSIAHEVFHDKFHSDCIAFRDLGDSQVNREEAQAELFAAMVLFPDLRGYETEDDFIRSSKLPKETADIRINYFRKTGI